MCAKGRTDGDGQRLVQLLCVTSRERAARDGGIFIRFLISLVQTSIVSNQFKIWFLCDRDGPTSPAAAITANERGRTEPIWLSAFAVIQLRLRLNLL